MRSKTSFFSWVLVKKQIIRFVPLWVAYALIWFFILPMPILTQFSPIKGETFSTGLIDYFCTTALVGGMLMAGFFSILAAMLVYGCFCNGRTASAFGTLPVRREGLFLSCCTAGLLPMLVINLLTVLLASLFAMGKGGVPFSTALQWLAVVSLLDIAFFGMATLAAGLTGNVFAMPVLYALIHFGALGVEALLLIVLYSVSFGMSPGNFPVTQAITPLWSLIDHFEITGYADGMLRIEGIGCCAAWAAVGVGMMAASMLLFKNRQLERASDVAATRLLRPIFRCIASAAGIAVGYGIYVLFFTRNLFDAPLSSNHLVGMLLCSCLGLVCGWLCCEMLLKKTLRVFRGKSFVRIGILSLLFIILTLFVYIDPFGLQGMLPDTDDIASVHMYSRGWDGVFQSTENIEAALTLNRNITENREEHRSAERSVYRNKVRFTYTLQDGSTVQKEYGLAEDSVDFVHFCEMLDLPEAVYSRNVPHVEVVPTNIGYASLNVYGHNGTGGEYSNYQELTDEMAYDLWINGIFPDIREGQLGGLYQEVKDESVVVYEDDASETWELNINVEYGFEMEEDVTAQGSRESERRSYTDWKYYTICESSRNTLAWINENYPELLEPWEDSAEE